VRFGSSGSSTTATMRKRIDAARSSWEMRPTSGCRVGFAERIAAATAAVPATTKARVESGASTPSSVATTPSV